MNYKMEMVMLFASANQHPGYFPEQDRFRNKFGMTLLVISCFLTVSFSSAKPKKFIPPGTVQITETFFADECEIDNLAWLEYEYWTKIKYGYKSPEHILTLPDTLVNREPLTWSQPYVEYYYRHPAYRNYPVIGVSFEQVLAYCKWRTERVKEFWALSNKTEINFEYRLPTKAEWEMLSLNGAGYLDDNGKDKKKF
jgi:formylglycine-generating enzyme required for sulfatase activity